MNISDLTIAPAYDHTPITIPVSGAGVTIRSLLPSWLADKIKGCGKIGLKIITADDYFTWGKTAARAVLPATVISVTDDTWKLDEPISGNELLDSYVASGDASTVAAQLIIYYIPTEG